MNPRSFAFLALATATTFATSAHAQNVRFTIDATRNVHAISRYIYGINGTIGAAYPNLTLRREGGNRWTAYNWENNASNAGSDFIFQNDDYLGGGETPGGAVIPAITNAKNHNAALLLTVPINGYVAADKNGGGDVRNSGLNYLQTRFRQSKAAKGSAFTLTPNTGDAFVYQDEFVNWVKTTYPYSQQPNTQRPIWFSLDNEPDLWSETHLEVHPDQVTYAEMVSKTTAYAAAIKTVAPNTLVFGPVSYGFNGYVNLQNAPDANNRDFLSFFLRKMQAAETTHGKRLLDVLDLHWYPEALGNGVRITGTETSPQVITARLQAPRSLWDAGYMEDSWIANDWYGGPINLLPRLKNKIATNYPGTRLAFTEYDYGGGQHISGGIAQADVLGIFGRDGVFAATQWPLRGGETFVRGAFKMYRAFDGATASFGDTSVRAVTNNKVGSSVYASLDSTNANRLVIVAINKTAGPLTATIVLSNAPALPKAHIYTLTSASSSPQSQGTRNLSNPAKFNYVMPAHSVSTIELTN
jgi:hypothetical protein